MSWLRELPWKDRMVEQASSFIARKTLDAEFVVGPSTRPARIAKEWIDRLYHYFPLPPPSEETVKMLYARGNGVAYVYSAALLARKFSSMPEGGAWEKENGQSPFSMAFILKVLLADRKVLDSLLAAMERAGDDSVDVRRMARWSESYWHTPEKELMRSQFGLGFMALCFTRKMPLLAAAANDTEKVRALLAAGEDPNCRDTTLGLSPVLLAAAAPTHPGASNQNKRGMVERVRMLLDAGADAGYPNALGMAPLHYAAQSRLFDLVSALLGAGADPSAKETYGKQPLHFAAAAHAGTTIRKLISGGADPDGRTSGGMTPLMFAAAVRPAYDIDESAKADAVRALLAGGANHGLSDAMGRTALHLAADNMNPETVRVLIEAGADVSATDNNGRTPKDIVESFHGVDYKGQKAETLKLLQAAAGAC